MTANDRLSLPRHAGRAMQALADVETVLDGAGLAPALRHLVLLRASQINGCAFCVDMHTRDARRDGETSARLDHLVVWRDVDHFTAGERAAFAWTEALTRLDPPQNLDALRAELARHFDDSEIAALTIMVGMINLWNRLNIASHGARRQSADAFALAS